MFHSRSDSKIFPFLFSEVCFLSSGGRLLLHLGHLWYFLGTLWQQSRGGVLAEVYPKLADTHLNNIRPMASKKYLILIYPRLPLCLRSKRVMVEWIPKVCLACDIQGFLQRMKIATSDVPDQMNAYFLFPTYVWPQFLVALLPSNKVISSKPFVLRWLAWESCQRTFSFRNPILTC
ncbi:hypothetical protein BDV35DRAFT_227196 [Aspergillus flavus]|uniref:Uncharacterized protein n=1 Tax=Aspergillus flavus TaxID=5059 RepID=A0A5N6HD58_ASPFL|nr:hypothetical protein BDV35DRAFT_227196 [Aspergillus flavus]